MENGDNTREVELCSDNGSACSKTSIKAHENSEESEAFIRIDSSHQANDFVDSESKTAYRLEMAAKRTKLLIVLIVPVVLVLIVWNFFDSDSRWDVNANSRSHKVLTVSEYMNELNHGFANRASYGEDGSLP